MGTVCIDDVICESIDTCFTLNQQISTAGVFRQERGEKFGNEFLFLCHVKETVCIHIFLRWPDHAQHVDVIFSFVECLFF